jgi:hypothetical protein
MIRLLLMSAALSATILAAPVSAHDGDEHDSPLACDTHVGESCYYAVIDDFHANPSTTDSMGEVFLTLNADRTQLRYMIILDDLLGLKPNLEDRTEPDDVVGMHFHIHVPDTIGPHVLNIFGLSTPTTDFGQEDADLVIDYENHTLTGIYDNSDATIDPNTGEPYPSFFFATSKPLSDTIHYLDTNEFVVAVHTNESGFQNFALHGHIHRIVPEPASGLLLLLGGLLYFAARGR